MHTIEQTVEVNNLVAALVGEEGVFEVTSPQGSVFEVTCRRGCRMSFREISDGKRTRGTHGITWRIRRLPRAAEQEFFDRKSHFEIPLPPSQR